MDIIYALLFFIVLVAILYIWPEFLLYIAGGTGYYISGGVDKTTSGASSNTNKSIDISSVSRDKTEWQPDQFNIVLHDINRKVLSDNAKIIIDGHNMIHSIPRDKPEDFNRNLEIVSSALIEAFPTQELHLVVKNPEFDDPRYLEKITRISNRFPTIYYHVAFDKYHATKSNTTKPNQSNTSTNTTQSNTSTKPNTPSAHHTKGRDDFLIIYLRDMLGIGDNYIISMDRFRDFNKFSDIRTFLHYQIHRGVISPPKKIEPLNYSILTKPTIYNQITYKLYPDNLSDEIGYPSGYIKYDSVGYATVYLKYHIA